MALIEMLPNVLLSHVIIPRVANLAGNSQSFVLIQFQEFDCLLLSECHGNGIVLERKARVLLLVSKKFNRATRSCFELWRDISCFHFPKQNPRLQLRSWYEFYIRRRALERERERDREKLDNESFIENCRLAFECPMRYSELSEIEGLDPSNAKFCTKCEKMVYRTDSIATVKSLSDRGECVSFFVSAKMLGRQIVIEGNANAGRERNGFGWCTVI